MSNDPNPIVRSLGATIDDADEKERSIVARISTGDIDRHRTIIRSGGVRFGNFEKNPTVLFEHGKSPNRGTLPVGRNAWIRSDGRGNGSILAKTVFADDEFSRMLFSFYENGTMRGWSISILPEEAGPPNREEIRSRPEMKDCETIYRSSDLLEYSCVSTPSCPNALTAPELRSLSKLVVRGFWQPPDDVKPLVQPIVERMIPHAAPAPDPALPPLVGRSLADVLAERSTAVDAWRAQTTEMIREAVDWLHGKV